MPRSGGFQVTFIVGDSQDRVWVNRDAESGETKTTRILPDDAPPETWITLAAERISQPGNAVISWRGVDRWNDTPTDELRFAWRLDDGDWSAYTSATSNTFLEFTDGDHTLEVRSRDREFNVDPTPAVTYFTVVSPVWKQAWFLGLIGTLLAAVAVQSTRVLRRGRRLAQQNQQLEERNRIIEQASLNKSQFLRRMSHDLRSPMNAIIGYTRLLQRRLADRMDAREARNLANIGTSSGNLLNLINDILDLSRIEAGHVTVKVQPVDVRRLAEECADALGSIVHGNVVLRRDLADVGVIHSDPDRLRQVVMNLLGNATKFTEAGSITLALRRSNGDTAIELSITDTGIGIPRDDLPHIFDEFRQVERQGGEQSEGTGLGLAIAKKTVELLGGEITATSEVGIGTTFTVSLPVAAPIKLMGGL